MILRHGSTHRSARSALVFGLAIALASGGAARASPSPHRRAEPAAPRPHAAPVTHLGPDVEVSPLAPGVWWFVAWADLPPWGRTPANGLVVASGREALMVNAGWTDAQAEEIAAWAERALGARITAVVPTHAHGDTIGGLAALHRRGAESWALDRTADLARAHGQEVPRHVFARRTELRVGDRAVQVAFHGAGHAPDNTVVWLPAERILFGGCLVKAAAARDPGNLADADVAAWPKTLAAVMAAYPAARVVVPGHGAPGGRALLTHTRALVAAISR